MKHLIVSIYDKATQAYMRPFTVPTEGQAVRMFQDEVLREGSEIGAHPEDYSMFLIGSFNDNDGLLEDYEPRVLSRAHEVKAQSGAK
jgi:hypothetical protein